MCNSARACKLRVRVRTDLQAHVDGCVCAHRFPYLCHCVRWRQRAPAAAHVGLVVDDGEAAAGGGGDGVADEEEVGAKARVEAVAAQRVQDVVGVVRQRLHHDHLRPRRHPSCL